MDFITLVQEQLAKGETIESLGEKFAQALNEVNAAQKKTEEEQAIKVDTFNDILKSLVQWLNYYYPALGELIPEVSDTTASEVVKALDTEIDELVEALDIFQKLATPKVEIKKKKRNPNCGGSVEESADPVQEFLKMYGLLQ